MARPTGDQKSGTAAGITGVSCCGCIGLASIVVFFLVAVGAIAAPDGVESRPAESTSATATVEAETPKGDATAPGSSEPTAAETARENGSSKAKPSATPELKPVSAPDASAPESLSSTSATDSAPGEKPAPAGTALAQLRTLEVKGRAPKSEYDRDSFGWRDDVDHNGCDTRNDILRRDVTNFVTKAGTHGCVVISGTVNSPYSGSSYDFKRNPTNTDIDHVVALSDAWQSGAASWDAQKKVAFANDPLNLLAVESTLNRQKGDGDAATWLPPNKAYRCEYVARQVAVKANYGLWVKPAEAEAIERVLGACPEMPAFDDNVEPTATDSSTDKKAKPSETPAPLVRDVQKEAPRKEVRKKESPKKKAPKKESSGGGFRNCKAAWEAGAAPLYRGDAGYASKLDGDDDGVACEARPRY
ncbi:DUF1524 domain-containing protein [Dermabacter sp. p3-SID358]|uniref:GmrSD restriction endonuclease domain-containing protein n=1 Tax=Dermabacter sp. p3-SID358 TaxID=2916114 RepID=UPI0021A6F7B3|nr:DUF1524 domain-containing protein [Dermabacter sp. p3-SID358]MCT1866325.1 DUF1524 domain-containing protein [Dermabacter sp. p3-SID358]